MAPPPAAAPALLLLTLTHLSSSPPERHSPRNLAHGHDYKEPRHGDDSTSLARRTRIRMLRWVTSTSSAPAAPMIAAIVRRKGETSSRKMPWPRAGTATMLSLIHISEPTRRTP